MAVSRLSTFLSLRTIQQVPRSGTFLGSTATIPSKNQVQAAIPCKQHHDDSNAKGESVQDHTFYEMRTYKIKPAVFPEFMKLTTEKMHLRMNHSKLIGYWAVDIGGISEVFHIWEYDCFAARTAVRAALGADADWQSAYFTKALQMFDVQENASASLLPWKPLQDKPIQEGGVYELRQYALRPNTVNSLMPRIMLRDETYSKLGFGKLMGAWMGDIGHCNTYYGLWNFVDADHRIEARKAVLEEDAFKNLPPDADALTSDMRSKVMYPLPFSPLK